MRINKIQFENFRNFLHEEIELPHYPVTVIYDKNGVGKTSLHEGILWAIAGEIYRYNDSKFKSEYGTIDALFSLRGNSSSRLHVRMEMENNDQTLILDVNRPRRNKTYLTNSQASQGSDLRCEIQDETLTYDDFRSRVTDIMGLDSRIIQTTNFLSQELVNESLVTDSKTRGNIFATMLSFGWMQDLHSAIKDEIDNLRRLKNSFQTQVNTEGSKLSESDINRLWESLMDKQKKMEDEGIALSTRNKITSTDYFVRELEVYRLINDEETVRSIEKEMETSSSEIPSKRRINLGIQRISSVIEDLNKRIGSLESSDTGTENVQKFMEAYDKNSEYTKLIHKHESELEKLRKKQAETSERKNKFMNSLNSLQSNLDTWKKFYDYTTTVFGELNNQFHINNFDNLLADLNEEIDQLAKELDRAKKIELEFSVEKKKFDSTKKQILSLENELEKLSNYSIDLVESKINAAIDLDISHFAELQSVLNDLRSADLEGKQQLIRQFQEILSSLPINFEKQELERNRSRLEKSKQQMEMQNSSDQLIKLKKKKVDELNGELENVNSEINTLNSKLEYLENSSEKRIYLIIIGSLFSLLGISLSVAYPTLMILGIILTLMGIFSFVLYTFPSITMKIFAESMLSQFIPLENRIGSIRSKIQILEKEKSEKIEEIHTEELEIQKLELDFQNTISALDNLPSLEELDRLEKQYHNLDTITKIFEPLISEIEGLILRQELSVKLNTLKQDLKSHQDKLEKFILQIFKSEKVSIGDFEISITELKTNINQRMVERKQNMKDAEHSRDQYLENKPAVSSMEEAEEVSKQLEQIKIDLNNTLNELKQIEESIHSHSKSLGKVKALKLEYDEYLHSILNSLRVNPEILQEDRQTVENRIREQYDKVGAELKTLNSTLDKCKSLLNELNKLKEFANTFFHLRKEWDKSQEKYNIALENIKRLNILIRNTEALENAWTKVNKAIKTNIDKYSKDIIENIKIDFIRYFEDLGGHDGMSYRDLKIKFTRNTVSVSIVVGENPKQGGSPKAVYSNGQQVCLILSLFFAMNKRVLQKYPLRYIGLDEPTQYLDSDRKADFAEFLDTYVNEVENPQILITTADREFVEILDEIGSDNVCVVSVEEILSRNFSELRPTHVKTQSKKKKAKEKKVKISNDPLPELISIPDSQSEIKKPKRSLNIYEEKEFICTVCHMPFFNYIYSKVCNKKECIKTLREFISLS